MRLKWTAAVAGLAAVAVLVVSGAAITLATGLSPKALYLQQWAQRNGVGSQRGTPPPSEKLPPSSFPSSQPIQFQAGIFSSRQGPYPSSQFLVNNSWRAPIDSTNKVWIAVFAGLNSSGNGETPSIPAVDVHKMTITPDGYSVQDQEVGIFAAPGANGGLTITTANGLVLTLRTDSGQVLKFDAVNAKYLQ